MKKFKGYLLAVALLISLSGVVAFAANAENKGLSKNDIRLSVAHYSDNVIPLAVRNLAETKQSFITNPGALGFTAAELSGMQIGNPFSIYVFDEELNITSTDAIVFPLLYLNNIIGVMEGTYDASSESCCFTFGKAYGNELNNLINQYTARANIVIGRLGDKLFATDGTIATTLLDTTVTGSLEVTNDRINASTASIMSEAMTGSNFVEATTPIGGTALSAESENQSVNTIATVGIYPNPLPVPHVAQTGICGEAAWAAVLNYRFNEDYTNGTLHYMMVNAGYSASPNMSDYVNYANQQHNAGCVGCAYVPGRQEMISAIDSGRPVMGSWYDANGGANKDWHAIIVTGYAQNVRYIVYILKNPWYNYTQAIQVMGNTPTTVVYNDAGYAWTMAEADY